MATNATMTSAAYSASGVAAFGQVLSGGSGSIPISLLPANSSAMTLECVVTRASAPSAVEVAMGSNTSFWLGVQATGGFAQARYGTGGTEVTLATTVNVCDGPRHPMKLVLDPVAGGKLFVDGNLVASSPITLAAAAPTRLNSIGIRIFGGGSNAWGGTVDEVAIWNIATDSVSYTPPVTPYTGAETGLVALYHLDNNGNDSAGVAAATAVTLTGPTSGAVGSASSAFTVGANGTITGTVVVTPSDGGAGGTFAPTTVSISSGSPTGTFTYTAAISGAKTISVTNNGGLTNPSNITYTASAAAAGFDQTKVLFSPKNWNVTSGAAKTINPGAYFRTVFSGASCSLQFDMTGILTPLPQIRYRIDNYGPWTVVDLAATLVLSMPSDTTTWPIHLLEFEFKSMTETQARWATQATAVNLVGIVLAGGGALTLPPAKAISIVDLGDSITEGCRTVKALGTPDVNSHDASLTALPEIARRLGAEYGVVGFSAQGFVTAGAGAVPALTSTWNFLYSGVSRDWTTNPPDAIFIAEGTNDSPDVTTAATTVINGLLAATPKTTKIVVFRPYNGTAHAGQLQAAIAASTAPTRCLYVDTAGMFTVANSSDNIHPYGIENISHIAPALTAAIQAFIQPIRGARTLRTITGVVTDAAGTPQANLTGLKWAVFDQTTADVLAVAADSGAGATTDASGNISISAYTTKGAGGVVTLCLSNGNGDPAQSPAAKWFFRAVVIS